MAYGTDLVRLVAYMSKEDWPLSSSEPKPIDVLPEDVIEWFRGAIYGGMDAIERLRNMYMEVLEEMSEDDLRAFIDGLEVVFKNFGEQLIYCTVYEETTAYHPAHEELTYWQAVIGTAMYSVNLEAMLSIARGLLDEKEWVRCEASFDEAYEEHEECDTLEYHKITKRRPKKKKDGKYMAWGLLPRG